MHSDSMKMLHHATCFINAVAALHLGLMAMGYNFLQMGFLSNLAMPIAYLFGLSGAVGLVMFFMHTFFCKCASSECGPR